MTPEKLFHELLRRVMPDWEMRKARLERAEIWIILQW